MTHTPSHRPPKKWARNGNKRSLWFKTYRERIRAGLESCRMCGAVRTDLTFGHIVPESVGGNLTFDNATIQCERCNRRLGNNFLRTLRSLAAEEEAALPEQRWAQLAREQKWALEGRPGSTPGKGAAHKPQFRKA